MRVTCLLARKFSSLVEVELVSNMRPVVQVYSEQKLDSKVNKKSTPNFEKLIECTIQNVL